MSACCSWLFRRLFEGAVVFCVLVFLPGIPPQMSFTAFSVTEPVELKGVFAVNDKLDGIEKLFNQEIKGPEGFAIFDGAVYTGLKGGRLVKVVGDTLVDVADLSHPCEGMWDEVHCGRILGMNFDKNGVLYVADAQYGVYQVNVKTGEHSLLFSSEKPIEGKKAILVNSLVLSSDASTMYWTTSSTEANLEDGLLSLLGDGSGRLFKFDMKTKTHTLLMDNLHFANGVALSLKEDFVVIAETVRGRLHRYWLKGPKAGQSEVFIDGLPGMPDNLRQTGHGSFFVPLVAARFNTMPVLSDVIAPYPLIRKFLARLICVLKAPFYLVNKYYPNVYTGTFTHMVSFNNFSLGNFLVIMFAA
ncbi:Hypothetical predicted protein [Cloeon dipterum]|uniref:Strictosidine synthase conserved region domain-containing protein n=1 Tax=Cloeon dipterum TaxID=197152 RepID=A0A8S1DV79_9INSE|nr:Hypothetical predicted protein [Cloeon dipterum]